jgi:3-deoxy-manno-octulosonate cytidylyltransferase (CMP-KDO synthetase)
LSQAPLVRKRGSGSNLGRGHDDDFLRDDTEVLVKTVIIIPARYASSRLPGKPLLRETGKYLIQHVYEQACQARCATETIVATDDPRIVAAVEHFGGKAVMTRRSHQSGTDRVAEVAQKLDADCIINLQGDEPLVDPASLDLLSEILEANPAADMATLAVPLRKRERWLDPNCVKVVCDDQGRALYFSRSPIPHVRDGEPAFNALAHRFLQHLGIYAYRRSFLLSISAMRPHPLEQLEKLEQLRALALGCRIQVGVVQHAAIGVDTLEDYHAFVRCYRQSHLKLAA